MEPRDDNDIEISLLIEAIYQKYNYDFRGYSFASLKRRVNHAVSQLGCTSVSALQDTLFRDATSFHRLLQYLTVPTSEMFRDPTYFRAFREQVCPILQTYPSLKFWIAGCSTGEEVYSFAILLREEGLLERTLIYATDINPQSLKQAKEGFYPADRVRKYTENYQAAGGKRSLADYYNAAYATAAFDRELVNSVVFADHSLATDEVFSEMHVVSCRNVLIYFNRALQSRAVALFHESLVHGGFLGIGSRESLQFTDSVSDFRTLNASERLFQKK